MVFGRGGEGRRSVCNCDPPHAFATLEDAKAAATVIARLHARCYEKAPLGAKHVWNRNTLEFERKISDADLRAAIKKKLRETEDHAAIAVLICVS